MIPFSAEVFLGLIASYNAAIFPLQILAWGLGLAALGQVLRPVRGGDRAVAGLLVGAWVWTGVVFHMLHFATINWAALAFGPVFALQGVALLIHGVLLGRLRFRPRREPASWLGLGCVLLALVGLPAMGLAAGLPIASLRSFILAPAPLTLFTLGLLLLTERPAPLHLFAVPLLWSLIAGAAAWFLGLPEDLLLPPAALAAVGLALARAISARGRS